MKLKVTKLAIFDFDGTLVDTPLPDLGRIQYKEKTGKDWPHVGWWGKAESLDTKLFDMKTVDMVISDYEKEVVETETAVVMLTGRMIKLASYVESILHEKGLKFDEYHYNRGGATFDAKIMTLEKLLKKYPDVTTISMWDDRDLHIDGFKAWANGLIAEGRLTTFNITHVKTGHF